MSSPLALALLSCLLLGFRHGFDYDHLAAITDITSVQRGWRDGLRLGTLYALGHAFTVALLGVLVIALHLALPRHLDVLAERLVGATLIALGVYVLVALWWQRRKLRYAVSHTHVLAHSRLAILVSGLRWLWWGARKPFRPNIPKPAPFGFRYSQGSVVTVGILHGLGAETPSQLLLFLLAANLGGISRGLLGLAAFLVGLLAMNTLMTASASGVFATSASRPRLQTAFAALTATYSFAVGTLFLLGQSTSLPPLVR